MRSAGEPVKPREMGVASDDGEEAVGPKVPAVPAKPSRMRTMLRAMQPIVRGVSIVRKGRGRISPHAFVSEEQLPEVGVD